MQGQSDTGPWVTEIQYAAKYRGGEGYCTHSMSWCKVEHLLLSNWNAQPRLWAYPEMGLTGVAMLLEPGIALLGVIPMSTDSTSKDIGGRPRNVTNML